VERRGLFPKDRRNPATRNSREIVLGSPQNPLWVRGVEKKRIRDRIPHPEERREERKRATTEERTIQERRENNRRWYRSAGKKRNQEERRIG